MMNPGLEITFNNTHFKANVNSVQCEMPAKQNHQQYGSAIIQVSGDQLHYTAGQEPSQPVSSSRSFDVFT